ncbi:MAG TPA: 16S rRNA (guanine(966)-N(2))-methyltransferase RsmD [Candidatus Avacidaminococcus intestinavium]|uniref:16S rRNA (Guanine(966)-N(2))-methyltransferase RsmD n=1 Tax=Candidatus Avacidaminococcus intestinavium TaxID=2840684 RepID=A0A9D1MQZ3_9FIRM|nr:16S rRNA (guanine(966)-N(2))-methyltransferase RsmD [Candidatus Avacidaminococcus intestinavium]
MRIITGKAKGLKLFTPKDDRVRPTADRVKESIFNIIGTKIHQAVVLDLFGGTGNLGLEAWSRGAEQVVFIDENKNSLALIKKNIAKVGAEKNTKTIKGDALSVLKEFRKKGEKFDFIFADPPYDKGLVKLVIEKIVIEESLEVGGYLVLEHSMHEILPLELSVELVVIRQEKYGESIVTFLRWR